MSFEGFDIESISDTSSRVRRMVADLQLLQRPALVHGYIVAKAMQRAVLRSSGAHAFSGVRAGFILAVADDGVPTFGENRPVRIELPPWPATPPTYGSVILREFRDEDAHLAHEMGEDEYIPLMGALPAHPTAEQALAYVRAQHQWVVNGMGFGFAIADVTTDRALGEISLSLDDLGLGIATVGYSVSPLHRRKGVASQALRALIGYAWTIPVLYRIELQVEPSNHASIGVAESAGFRQVRLLPKFREIGGVKRDSVLYALKR